MTEPVSPLPSRGGAASTPKLTSLSGRTGGGTTRYGRYLGARFTYPLKPERKTHNGRQTGVGYPYGSARINHTPLRSSILRSSITARRLVNRRSVVLAYRLPHPRDQ